MRRHRKPAWLEGAKGRRFRGRLHGQYGGRCFYCRRGFPSLAEVTFDHFVPLSVWRRGYPKQNIVPACGPCNRAKADRLPLGLVLVLLGSGVKADIAPQPGMREAA